MKVLKTLCEGPSYNIISPVMSYYPRYTLSVDRSPYAIGVIKQYAICFGDVYFELIKEGIVVKTVVLKGNLI